MRPSVGRTVLYRLDDQDAAKINRRRTTRASVLDRINSGTWPLGAQVHIGNPVVTGEQVPMIVTAVWPTEYGPEGAEGSEGVNGQCLLDGSDTYWVTSARQGEEVSQWCFPTLPVESPDSGSDSTFGQAVVYRVEQGDRLRSAIDVVARVKEGQFRREAGVLLLTAFLGMSQEDANVLLGGTS